MTTTFDRIPVGHHYDLHMEHHFSKSHNSGTFIADAGWKFVVHITVSPRNAVDGMIDTLLQEGFEPHLVLGMRPGLEQPVLAQLLDFSVPARALEHPPGTPETNRARCIQIEVCGEPDVATARAHRGVKTDAVEFWPLSYYRALANTFYLLTHGANPRVPIKAKVPRLFSNPKRFTPAGFIELEGICGHMHAPSQLAGHTDPTTKFSGTKLLSGIRTAPNPL